MHHHLTELTPDKAATNNAPPLDNTVQLLVFFQFHVCPLVPLSTDLFTSYNHVLCHVTMTTARNYGLVLRVDWKSSTNLVLNNTLTI